MEHEIINGVEILTEPSQGYAQINDASEEELRSVWPKLLEKYTGYELFFCFRNVPVPSSLMEELGAKLLDDSLEMRLSVPDFEEFLKAVIADVGAGEAAKVSVVGVTPITEENFEAFATFHDKSNPDMYWTSRRILERIDLWQIFACFDETGGVSDYVMLMRPAAEIFCCYTKDATKAKALLAAAAQNAFVSGAEETLYMIDKDESLCINAATALGFRQCGFYQGYRVIVNYSK
ncbi:MAG: hypothetical protein FWB91_12460 [Defluviitaleaceae bacterium]|nr:hypothetical protein [Defluviitaleaceae bacterium]